MASSKRSVEKEQFWRLLVAEHAASGLSVRAFCLHKEVSVDLFYFWRRELAARDAKSDSHQLVPVRIVDPVEMHSGYDSSTEENDVIEVSIPGGFTLRAGSATDAERVGAWIAAIVKVAAV